MFKRIIFTIIGTVVAMATMAQVTVNRGGYSMDGGNPQKKKTAFMMKYGVKAGLNLTSMSNDMPFEPGLGMGAGFRAGGFLNLRWGQRTENSLPGTGFWGLQPELIFSNEGVTSDAGNVRMNFVSLPILLKLYPTTGFNIEVGPEFSYMISTSPSTMAVDGAEFKVGDCKGLNAGIAAGLAYDLECGLTFGARYTYRFADMAKNLKWKNSNLQVAIGWMF